RGEGWVVAQLVVGGVVVVLGFVGPGWPSSANVATSVVGIVLAAGGLAMASWGIASLGSSLSPFPRPAEGARFLDHGAYGTVRHPIYGGLVLGAVGWSLIRSPLALVATAVLAMILELKSRSEESMLVAAYPEYAAYRDRVRWRFIPGVR
ncbi:MAG TPA: isoprenylcysteine carboxylmethyltransferase family protein, partial [Actinomycetota bacterium]